MNNFTYGPAIYNAGFSGAVPKADAVRKGLYQGETLDKRVPALVLWADIFGVVAYDKVTVKITSPDGDVLLNHTSTNPKTLARRLAYAGKKNNARSGRKEPTPAPSLLPGRQTTGRNKPGAFPGPSKSAEIFNVS